MPDFSTLVAIDGLAAASALSADNLVEVFQDGVSKRATISQLATGANAAITSTNNFVGNIAINKESALVSLGAFDNGSSYGAMVQVGRNSNSPNGAPGVIRIQDRLGNWRPIWPDSSGLFRYPTSTVTNTLPTTASDTVGTALLSSQTSHESFKTVVGDASGIQTVLERVQAAAWHVQRFQYQEGAPGLQDEEYEGLILREDAPATWHYGHDREPGIQAGKALNIINLCGDLLRSVAYLAERVAVLEAQQGGGGD